MTSRSAETAPARAAEPFRLAVLVSGNGSNLQAILDACTGGTLDAEVRVVVSNRREAYALTRAAEAGVPALVMEQGDRTRRDYDAELARTVATVGVDLVVLAGWDRLLSEAFVAHHPVINLHPAKPGVFRGLGAIEKAYAGWREGTVSSGGVMVHFVPDEGVDDGPVIVTEEVPFEPDDTLDSFAKRVHATEHRLLVKAIAKVIAVAARQPLR
ncbi:MAG: phosphoribosylglycinamide formyltransferase [Acidimicrobiia bacterium]|nr:phosphoribosylglycinamide formyltransferase [Acidimicrobiia bacterium]